jgi:hypothetical protein
MTAVARLLAKIERHCRTAKIAETTFGRIVGTKRPFSDYRDEVHAMEKKAEFDGLTISVKSQLRKALMLHAEFSSR